MTHDDLSLLHHLRRTGRLAPTELGRAIGRSTPAPSRADWATFLHGAGLVFGTALALAGVLYLVAFNWTGLGPWSKLAALLAGATAATAGADRLGLSSLGGRLCAVAAPVLAGGALVVYSQVYQSGADPWELFASWALIALPYALAARTPALWAAWCVLLDVTVCAWFAAELPRHEAWCALALAAGHVALSVVWRRSWLGPAHEAAAAVLLTGLAAAEVAVGGMGTAGALALGAVFAVGPALQLAYAACAARTSTATLGILSMCAVVDVGIARALDASGAAALGLLGTVVLGQAVFGLLWLRWARQLGPAPAVEVA